MPPAYILAIETSCDETAAAVLKDGGVILSDIIYSQADIHKKYGGVVPEVASRKHLDVISQVVSEAMGEAGLIFAELDAVAATYGPGLAGALLAGLSYAKGLAYAIKKPLIGVNHIEGHICANFLSESAPSPPFVCLVASGGHTHLVAVSGYTEYRVIGKTRDDACGEAFDKTARALGLGYPGGPIIDAISKTGDPASINFPRAMTGDFTNFSFSGLKSAAVNHINKTVSAGAAVNAADVAASFQRAVVDVLVEKTVSACKFYKMDVIALSGGVASNSALRAAMSAACGANGFRLYMPPPALCTDNAAMIARRAFFDCAAGRFDDLSLNADPGLRLD